MHEKEVVLVRRIGIVFGVAAVMAAAVALTAGTALAQAITDHSRTNEPFTEIIENPCTGEEILFEGTFRQVTHFVQNDNGLHGGVIEVVTATGTGVESGERYRFINSVNSAFYNGNDGMVVDDVGREILVVSNGASPNFVTHLRAKATTDLDDGQPSTSFEMAVVGCTPEVETTHTRQ